ncbi:RNA polymerase sigma-28 (SigD/FliA/WhiG) subunit [Halanaerobium saccharolyticum]|uniref:RNA polymerase sigma-28 (SigD/FliA/WhiG) subunit n=1 Tax=Halanaerobium saccharolyticum TaxID=43595 RepID=A0A4R7YQD7_9FIRM|nr:FliA/WhiG family RNA polymerase sigma factor [Halanaerobium saccharolyticum]RAK08919.1 RNA polymerase sigma-28 (SigD/FliA/WhiG) subunit [Halanaerobium saccharolyticum]TDV98959.1 RNA polymerase sigma-28 (SigD/FliA/WhiG) subunit [Halanaerobium saccharolyticum]TDX60682.1 RNA polymerase sigma-28 (SigD/FliA/WhiG) subunit [Halanaerobium saccharolyticum]
MAVDKSLWKNYKVNDNQQAREEIILKHLGLVRYAVGRIIIMLPDHIEAEDLESYGIIGLIEALEKFDYQRGVEFSTFALPRIKGEIYDYLRSKDWLPDNMRRELKLVKEERENFKAETGREPDQSKLAELAGIKEDRLNTIERHSQLANWISLSHEFEGVELMELIAADLDQAVDKLTDEEALNLLTQKLELLSKNEKLVLTLYYYEELTQVEIAEVMELSAARVSQIHSQAIRRLRGMLSRSKEYFF